MPYPYNNYFVISYKIGNSILIYFESPEVFIIVYTEFILWISFRI